MLKIKMTILDRCVVMHVLEQAEYFRSTESEIRLDFEATNFSFSSRDHPSICDHEIYLRGEDRSLDLSPSFHSFETNEERDEWLLGFRRAFTELKKFMLQDKKEVSEITETEIKTEYFSVTEGVDY